MKPILKFLVKEIARTAFMVGLVLTVLILYGDAIKLLVRGWI